MSQARSDKTPNGDGTHSAWADARRWIGAVHPIPSGTLRDMESRALAAEDVAASVGAAADARRWLLLRGEESRASVEQERALHLANRERLEDQVAEALMDLDRERSKARDLGEKLALTEEAQARFEGQAKDLSRKLAQEKHAGRGGRLAACLLGVALGFMPVAVLRATVLCGPAPEAAPVAVVPVQVGDDARSILITSPESGPCFSCGGEGRARVVFRAELPTRAGASAPGEVVDWQGCTGCLAEGLRRWGGTRWPVEWKK